MRHRFGLRSSPRRWCQNPHRDNSARKFPAQEWDSRRPVGIQGSSEVENGYSREAFGKKKNNDSTAPYPYWLPHRPWTCRKTGRQGTVERGVQQNISLFPFE